MVAVQMYSVFCKASQIILNTFTVLVLFSSRAPGVTRLFRQAHPLLPIISAQLNNTIPCNAVLCNKHFKHNLTFTGMQSSSYFVYIYKSYSQVRVPALHHMWPCYDMIFLVLIHDTVQYCFISLI